MRTIEVNGNKYPARPIDFNTIADLEDLNITLGDFNKKHTSFLRGYVSLCMGADIYMAGAQLGEHMANGGDFAEITKVINQEIEESGFFHTIKKRVEEKLTEVKKETKTITEATE